MVDQGYWTRRRAIRSVVTKSANSTRPCIAPKTVAVGIIVETMERFITLLHSQSMVVAQPQASNSLSAQCHTGDTCDAFKTV